MICPSCKAEACRRSRRKSIYDFFASIFGPIPWRCSKCGTRFRSRTSPLSHLLSAHCGICGNLELKRISAEHATGWFAFIWRPLGVPAYRCVPCRNKFFSFLPFSKEKEVEDTELKIAS